LTVINFAFGKKDAAFMKGIIDLHTHTFFSDGELSPAELVRRAENAGYEAIGLTDHADWSNIDFILENIIRFRDETQKYVAIKILPGVELTHVPPGQILQLTDRARSLGALVVVLHGETITEPVAPGTNRAGIEAGVDILAHPGLLSEDDANLAAEKGVMLEITGRYSHGLANGRVASLARKAGAKMSLDTDTHSPSDLFSAERRKKVALGADLSEDELEAIESALASFVFGRIEKHYSV
jgi:putative hydrolase